MKISLIFYFAFFAILLFSCNSQPDSTTLPDEKNDPETCLTKENFDLVKDYISKYGAEIKLYKAGIMTDTTVMSKQVFIDGRTVALIDFNNCNHIIVISKVNENNIPVYIVSNESAPCQISAYYSVIDTEGSIRARKDDWCSIVSERIKTKDIAITIDRETALGIAKKDAQTAYRDLSIYDIRAEIKDGNWYVDYDLSDPDMLGGGPHYIICGRSGSILMRMYEQ